MNAVQMKVYDVIETPGNIFRRLYLVQGIHLGAINQESVVELMPLDKKTADVHGQRQNAIVPLEMIEAGIAAGIFSVTRSQEQEAVGEIL